MKNEEATKLIIVARDQASGIINFDVNLISETINHEKYILQEKKMFIGRLTEYFCLNNLSIGSWSIPGQFCI